MVQRQFTDFETSQAPWNVAQLQGNRNRFNDILQAHMRARRIAGEDEGRLNRPQPQDRIDIADPIPQIFEPRRPGAVRALPPDVAQARFEQARLARAMDGAERRLQGLHLGREQQDIWGAMDDPGEGRVRGPNREADVGRQIQALENRFLAAGPPEGFEMRDGQLAAIIDRGIDERPLNPNPIVQRPPPPQPHQAALAPVGPIVPPPGLDQWRPCPHQQWRKDTRANQACSGCFRVQKNYILVCDHCEKRRCKKCKRRIWDRPDNGW